MKSASPIAIATVAVYYLWFNTSFLPFFSLSIDIYTYIYFANTLREDSLFRTYKY